MLEILLTLANNKVELTTEQKGLFDNESLESILISNNLCLPDSYNREINNGKWTVLAYWESSSIVALAEEPDEEEKNYLIDNGFEFVVIGKDYETQKELVKKNYHALPKA